MVCQVCVCFGGGGGGGDKGHSLYNSCFTICILSQFRMVCNALHVDNTY